MCCCAMLARYDAMMSRAKGVALGGEVLRLVRVMQHRRDERRVRVAAQPEHVVPERVHRFGRVAFVADGFREEAVKGALRCRSSIPA